MKGESLNLNLSFHRYVDIKTNGIELNIIVRRFLDSHILFGGGENSSSGILEFMK